MVIEFSIDLSRKSKEKCISGSFKGILVIE